ncbi:MAG: TPM domain-containing protein [Candidatus Liptonbacteria bacterium]|nr:TPM domain-containing protein [Candidatus Liptonbacteria bacterium]
MSPKGVFTEDARREIAEAIQAAERNTSGEIRVMVRARCDADILPRCGTDFGGRAYDQAVREFERQGMTKTRDRTGVLILLVWEERRFAIVGDTGIHAKLGDDYWIVRIVELKSYFVAGEYVRGLVAVVGNVGRELAKHFPRKADDRDELPDAPIVEDNR